VPCSMRTWKDGAFGADGYWTMRQCRECRSAFLSPRPDPASIGTAYRNYYTHTNPTPPVRTLKNRVGDALRAAIRHDYLNAVYGYRLSPALPFGRRKIDADPHLRGQADRHVALLPAPRGSRRLLDIGCGNGALMERLAGLGWLPEGMDPDPSAVAACAERGFSVVCALPAEDTVPDGPFEAICLSHVIEHTSDPVGLLRLCRERLTPGGHLYLETPNIESLGHTTFGRDWRGLEPPRHFTVFSVRGLRAVCERAGLVVEKIEGYPTLIWLVQESARLRACRVARDSSAVADPVEIERTWADLAPQEAATVDAPERADIVMLRACRSQ
jgi:SAM-dependent methyltransferase